MSLQVTDGLTVTVIPNPNHEFLMSSFDVAHGYGTSEHTIRQHKKRQISELFEGKHFVTGVTNSHSDPHNKVYWTKRGIVRLGFFIKSERAKLFRDWAEDLVISKTEQPKPLPEPKKAIAPQSKRLRLEYSELVNLVDSASVLCGSHARLAKRLGISQGIFTHLVKHPNWLSEEMMLAIETGCRNIISNSAQVDTETLEALMKIESNEVRITLFNKLKKGGLI